jgi:hypothetical protein
MHVYVRVHVYVYIYGTSVATRDNAYMTTVSMAARFLHRHASARANAILMCARRAVAYVECATECRGYAGFSARWRHASGTLRCYALVIYIYIYIFRLGKRRDRVLALYLYDPRPARGRKAESRITSSARFIYRHATHGLVRALIDRFSARARRLALRRVCAGGHREATSVSARRD